MTSKVKKLKSGNQDLINKPDHYNTGDIECIQAIKSSMTSEAFKGYLKGNVQKYMWRYEHKHKDNKVQDLDKAEWYLKYLICVEIDENI
tara:strand:- start:1375 stop:1641 length:267 start_codon:yes stop_codon:yes gene_type:complete